MEHLANLGYLAIKKEVTPGVVADTPDIFIPIYSETLATDGKYIEDSPIMAEKFFRYQVLRGLRSHGGGFVCMGEPNSATYLADMLLTEVSSTGSNPTTSLFKLLAANPHSYTVEIGLGNMAVRYPGFGASSITPEPTSEGDVHLNIEGSALKSFETRSIASKSGSGPYVLTLTTDYSSTPTDGLVVGDIIQVFDVSAGANINAIVDGLTDTTVTVSEDVSAAAAGDILSLRSQTPSWNLGEPFHWGRTQFHFGADATAALAATHTPLEQDTSIKLIHEFKTDTGEPRSGSYDPASLIRLRGDIEFKVKQYFDTPEEMARFHAITQRACVVRFFSGTVHELRITMNNLRAKSSPRAMLSASEVLYSEVDFVPAQDVSAGQPFDVKVLSAVTLS